MNEKKQGTDRDQLPYHPPMMPQGERRDQNIAERESGVEGHVPEGHRVPQTEP